MAIEHATTYACLSEGCPERLRGLSDEPTFCSVCNRPLTPMEAGEDVTLYAAKVRELESEAAALRRERDEIEDEIDEQWTTWAADLAKRIDPHNEHGDLEAGQVIESAVNEVGALRAEVARLRDILAVLYRDDVDAAEARADLAQRRVEELEGLLRGIAAAAIRTRQDRDNWKEQAEAQEEALRVMYDATADIHLLAFHDPDAEHPLYAKEDFDAFLAAREQARAVLDRSAPTGQEDTDDE